MGPQNVILSESPDAEGSVLCGAVYAKCSAGTHRHRRCRNSWGDGKCSVSLWRD